jgi:hypothetical protein
MAIDIAGRVFFFIFCVNIEDIQKEVDGYR